MGNLSATITVYFNGVAQGSVTVVLDAPPPPGPVTPPGDRMRRFLLALMVVLGVAACGSTSPGVVARPQLNKAQTVGFSPRSAAAPVVGEVLTTSNGTWTNNPTSFAYQWQRCTSSCTNISGATSSSYTVQTADVGDAIDVVVTATNAGGSASQTSAPTGVVTQGSGPTVNYFVAQAAAGTGTGSGSCSNAAAVSTLSTATHWTAGNVIGLCGTITSSITAQASGTSGNPITLYWEPGASMSEPACPGGNGACVVISNESYITLNGGTNGIIQDTANGTAGITNADTKGVTALNCNNCTIENLTIENMYLRTSTSDTCGNANGCGAIETANNAIQFSGSNMTIENNDIHDGGWLLDWKGGHSDSNIVISGNEIYHMDHGIIIAPAAGTYGNIFIAGNHIHDEATWDCGSGCHHDPIHCFGGENGNAYSGIYIYDNRIDGAVGATYSSGTFIEGNYGASGDTPCAAAGSPVWIFNNYVTATDHNANCCGWLGNAAGAGGMFNNTTRGDDNTLNTGRCMGFTAGPPGGSELFDNNVMDNCNFLIIGASPTSGSSSPYTSGSLDSDAYIDGGGNAFSTTGPNGANCNFMGFGQFAAWKTCMGGVEAHGAAYATDTAAGISSTDGSLTTGSPLIGAGDNLTSTCAGFPTSPVNAQAGCETTYTGPPLNGAAGSTTAGSARSSTGSWNIGAY